MVLQVLGDLVHVGLDLAVLGLHGLNAVAGLFEQTRQALLLLRGTKAFQFHHQAAEILADLAHILVADISQRTLREGGYAFLGSCAVLQHLIGVAHIDLFGEFVNGGTFLLRQHALIQHHRFYLFLYLRSSRSGGSLGGKGQGGDLRSCGGIGGQRQFRQVVISHRFDSFLYDFDIILLFVSKFQCDTTGIHLRFLLGGRLRLGWCLGGDRFVEGIVCQSLPGHHVLQHHHIGGDIHGL